MDIVERLRKESYWTLSKEAAAEIERSRKRIECLQEALNDVSQYISRADYHYLKDETRDALKGDE